MVKQKPEEKARQHINKLLEGAGWTIQDYPEFNLGASLGVAVREFPLYSGFTDYLLFLGRNAGGVLEAKPEGTTLSGVSEQTAKYLTGIPGGLPKVQELPPFSYESTGTETYFRDTKDPDTRSRRIFSFHKPETLKEWSSQPDTLRSRLKIMPSNYPLIREGLRDCQFEAIQNLEQSFAQAR
jgi:type I restriction enzyme R subunit